MARHGKAHGHSHGHFWLAGLPALAAGLFLMIYMPTLPVVSGTMLLFAGFHIVGGLIVLATLFLAGGGKLARHQQAALASGGDFEQRCLGFTAPLFEHVAHFRPIYRAMAGERGSVIVMSRMRGLLTDLVRDDLTALAVPREGDPMPRSALVQFVVGALVSMTLWWVERDPPPPPATVDSMFRRLVLPSLAAALRPNRPVEA